MGALGSDPQGLAIAELNLQASMKKWRFLDGLGLKQPAIPVSVIRAIALTRAAHARRRYRT